MLSLLYKRPSSARIIQNGKVFGAAPTVNINATRRGASYLSAKRQYHPV